MTRTCTDMYNTQSNTAQKWHGFSFGEIDVVVLWVVEIDVISVWGIGVDYRNWLDLSVGSKITWFSVGDINWLGFSVSTEIDLFWGGGQNWLCFCVRIENYLFLVLA